MFTDYPYEEGDVIRVSELYISNKLFLVPKEQTTMLLIWHFW